MRRFRCGIDGYNGWKLELFRNWYDGPFWDLQIGPFWAVWNLSGLPKIFQGEA